MVFAASSRLPWAIRLSTSANRRRNRSPSELARGGPATGSGETGEPDAAGVGPRSAGGRSGSSGSEATSVGRRRSSIHATSGRRSGRRNIDSPVPRNASASKSSDSRARFEGGRASRSSYACNPPGRRSRPDRRAAGTSSSERWRAKGDGARRAPDSDTGTGRRMIGMERPSPASDRPLERDPCGDPFTPSVASSSRKSNRDSESSSSMSR